MKTIFQYTLSLVALICVGGCSILDQEPEVITSDTYYQNESEFLYGLAGIYGAINNEELYGRCYSLPISNTDDLCYQNRVHNTSAVYWYNHNASDADVLNAWRMLYAGIKNANEFLEAVERSDFDPELKEQYYEEARFLRAFFHFLLAQAWGDVPLRIKATKSPDPEEVNLAATPQAEVLMWCATEMESAFPKISNNMENAPSRVVQTTAAGILARLYLFMAGETVKPIEGGLSKSDLFAKAAYWAKVVIDSKLHDLNPDYSMVFKNMITDTYDKVYYESMWEADFLGNRSSADEWSNGRIGDLIGLQSNSSETDYDKWNCNYSYAQYNGSLKLWDLYWVNDRADDETATDARQLWNLPPYNYKGGTIDNVTYIPSKDKTPYVYSKVNTFDDPMTAVGIRNCGKWRREADLEGHQNAKNLYTRVNFPILRYSDVLLMYAEAENELNGPSEELLGYVEQVRSRAGVATRPYSEYSTKESFRELVRNERGRELCFEALRKYDLIRWGIFVEAMRSYNQQTSDPRWEAGNQLASFALQTANSVQPKHIYLPIPTKELGVNIKLKQNSMW